MSVYGAILRPRWLSGTFILLAFLAQSCSLAHAQLDLDGIQEGVPDQEADSREDANINKGNAAKMVVDDADGDTYRNQVESPPVIEDAYGDRDGAQPVIKEPKPYPAGAESEDVEAEPMGDKYSEPRQGESVEEPLEGESDAQREARVQEDEDAKEMVRQRQSRKEWRAERLKVLSEKRKMFARANIDHDDDPRRSIEEQEAILRETYGKPQFEGSDGEPMFHKPATNIHQKHLDHIEKEHDSMVLKLAEEHLPRIEKERHFEEAYGMSKGEYEAMQKNHRAHISDARQHHLFSQGISLVDQMLNPSYYAEGGLYDHETVHRPAFQKKREAEVEGRRQEEVKKYRSSCKKKGGKPYSIQGEIGRFSVGCELQNKRMFFRREDGELIKQDITRSEL